MPEGEKESGCTVSVQFREGIEEVSPGEIRLIEANQPELLKFLMEELAREEE